jgi:hypothetical protein
LIRGLALSVCFSIAGCDPPLFFFSEPEPAPECPYQIELRCSLEAVDGIFAHKCQPKLTIDQTCAFLVDASACGVEASFSGAITEDGVVTDACTATGFEVVCDRCEVAFVKERPLPYRVVGEGECVTESCRRGELRTPGGYGDHLVYGLLKMGWLPEIVADSQPRYLVNSAYRDWLGCPAGQVEVALGTPSSSERTAAQPCLHRLERGGAFYFGVFGEEDLMFGRFDERMQLDDAVSLTATIGEVPTNVDYFNNRGLAYDPETNRIALSIGSASFYQYLLLIDATTLEIVSAGRLPKVVDGGAPLTHEVTSIQRVAGGWLYVDDLDDTIVKTSPDALHTRLLTSPPTRDVRGRSELGAMLTGALGTFERGAVAANMASEGNELLLIEETEQQLAIRGSARAISPLDLTPTELAWAGDLIAVGLVDRQRLEAHLGFFDPKTLRFLPGTILVGRGVIGRIRYTGDRLWLALPWEGKLVELEHADLR